MTINGTCEVCGIKKKYKEVNGIKVCRSCYEAIKRSD